MSGFGSFAGGLASGLMTGAKLGSMMSDKKDKDEERDRRRKDQKEEDAVKAAGANAWKEGEGSGLQSAIQSAQQQPQMSMAPAEVPADGVSSAEGAGLSSVLQQAAQRPEMSTAPQQEQPGLKQGSVQSEAAKMQRILRASEAAMNEAGAMGNWELFSKHFKTGADVRGAMRAQSLDTADRQFAMTGDWNAYLPAYNNFVADGNKINSIQKQDSGGYLISAAGADGKEISRLIKDDTEMKTLVGTMMDPAAMRKLEAAKAIRDYEFAAKTKEAVAIERVKGEERQKYAKTVSEGDIEEINARAKAGGYGGLRGHGGGSGRDLSTAEMKNYNFYVSKGMSHEDALKTVTSKKRDTENHSVTTKPNQFTGQPETSTTVRRPGLPQSSAAPTPQGIPEGSKQIGTSGGKPVFQSPDGKKFIVK